MQEDAEPQLYGDKVIIPPDNIEPRQWLALTPLQYRHLKAWAEGPDLVRLAVEANVRRQADELLRLSPLLRKAVTSGEVPILKAVYDLDTGRVRPL